MSIISSFIFYRFLGALYMKFIHSIILSEVIIIEPDIYRDDRGYFLETYRAEKYSEHGIQPTFVQDNMSFSRKNVLRGLHYQLECPQGKLVSVIQGEILDVAVDIRKNSPTFGKWISAILSSENHRQLYIPEGFGHGFCVRSKTARVYYKCTEYYDPASERGIIWNDSTLNIDWTVVNPIISEKDSMFPKLEEISEKDLPVFYEKYHTE